MPERKISPEQVHVGDRIRATYRNTDCRITFEGIVGQINGNYRNRFYCTDDGHILFEIGTDVRRRYDVYLLAPIPDPTPTLFEV